MELTTTQSERVNEAIRRTEVHLSNIVGIPCKIHIEYIGKITKTLTPQEVVQIVSDNFGIAYDDIFSQLRERKKTEARHTAQSLVYKYCKITLVDAAKFFGRDHSTIIHARRNVKNYMDIYIGYRQKIDIIEAQIKNAMLEKCAE